MAELRKLRVLSTVVSRNVTTTWYIIWSIEGRLICQIVNLRPRAAIWHINRPSMLYIIHILRRLGNRVRLNSATWYNCNKKPIYAQRLLKFCYTMPECGRCQMNTSEPQPQLSDCIVYRSQQWTWIQIDRNCGSSNGESQPWLWNHHSYHGAEVPYSPIQMSNYLPVYMMKLCFCRVSKPSFSSVSCSFVHHSQLEFDRKPFQRWKPAPATEYVSLIPLRFSVYGF